MKPHEYEERIIEMGIPSIQAFDKIIVSRGLAFAFEELLKVFPFERFPKFIYDDLKRTFVINWSPIHTIWRMKNKEIKILERDAVFEFLKINDGEQILDAGCGWGQYSAEVASKGATVYAVDNDSDQIFLAVLYLSALDLHFNYSVIDIQYHIFEEEFDKVFCCNVLEHIDNDAAALDNLIQSLKPNGQIVIIVPINDEIGEDKRLYKYGCIREQLERIGFQIEFQKVVSGKAELNSFQTSEITIARKKN